MANQYIEKNSEITINHQVAVPFKRCHCGDSSKCTASLSLVPPVRTPPISVVPESSSSSPLIDPTVSHSSDDDVNKPLRNKRTRQQRNMKKSTKRIIKRTMPKVLSPPPPTLQPPLPPLQPPPPPVKNKEPNGPGRPKSPIKKVETSPESDNKSNNDNKMVKRLNEMVNICNIDLMF